MLGWAGLASWAGLGWLVPSGDEAFKAYLGCERASEPPEGTCAYSKPSKSSGKSFIGFKGFKGWPSERASERTDGMGHGRDK